MKILDGNVAKCDDCNCVMEYNANDVIPAVECPKCGKLVKADGFVPLVAAKLFDSMSWDEVCATPAELFTLGATKKITLKNGEQYEVQVTHRKNGLMLSFKDLYGTDENGGKAINENKDYERTYKDSDIRKWLNGEFFALLPDDLAQHIVPAEIASNGEVLKDKIFIPSETEVFGKQEYGNCAEGEQLELYKDWHNRISGYADGQYGRWWWLRTKAKASADYFCRCYNYGRANYHNVSNSNGVRPHFLIK